MGCIVKKYIYYLRYEEKCTKILLNPSFLIKIYKNSIFLDDLYCIVQIFTKSVCKLVFIISFFLFFRSHYLACDW